MYLKNKILYKIECLNHQLKYLEKVYPGCKKINKIETEIEYYIKKLSSLCD